MKKVLLICLGLLISVGALTYTVIIPEPVLYVCNGEYIKSGKTSAGKLYFKHTNHHILMRIYLGIESSEGVLTIETMNGYLETFYHLNGGNYMVISKKSPEEIPNDVSKRADNIKGTYLSLSRKLSLGTELDGLFTGQCVPRKLNTLMGH
jgi:hypothetical protein